MSLRLLPLAVAVAAVLQPHEAPTLAVSQDLVVAQLVAAPVLLEVAAQLAPDEVKDHLSHLSHPRSARARDQLALLAAALPVLERLEMEKGSTLSFVFAFWSLGR